MLKRLILRFTFITHDQLIALGFNDTRLFYTLADLDIMVNNNKFYYFTPSVRKKRIRNMLEISNLVYGKTEYLR